MNRPEAILERHVLRRVGELQRGAHPHLVVFRNEVGVGYQARARDAVRAALKPFGLAAGEAALAALMRCRVTYGLGVGSPDLVGAVNGRAFGIELKSDEGRLEPEQLAWHQAAARRRVLVRVARTVDEAVAAIDEAAS